jgi:hypothetical protein
MLGSVPEPGPLGMVLLIVSGKPIEWAAVQSFTSPVMLSQSVYAERHLARRGGPSSAICMHTDRSTDR